MPGLAGSDGSPLVAWPFVVKFLVPPRRPPAVCGPRCHHPPPRAPPRNYARMPRAPPRSSTAFSPPRSIIRSEIFRSFSLLSSLVVPSIYFHFLVSLHLSLAQSSLALLYISFARAFPRNLLISSVFRVFSPRDERLAPARLFQRRIPLLRSGRV